MQSAVLRLHVSVRDGPPVCDVGGSESHRLKILETNYTDYYPNTFGILVAKSSSTYSQGNMGKIWGD